MPDLNDGESVEMHGSASRPYILKNVGGVYSCTCPAWRNQSLSIERRTCKHLQKWRGAAAEEARVGAALPSRPVEEAGERAVPPLLLAESWDGATDPKGWLLSEKLDGVRAWWTGTGFLSRQGNDYHAPAWFTAGLPKEPLDGELWIGRKQFQRTVSIVRRQDQTDLWKEVRFLIFDAPTHDGEFPARLKFVESIIKKHTPAYALAHEHSRCKGVDHLREELTRIEALGGEGLMLRQPDSRYEAGRSVTLLKVKTFRDDEARVLAYEPGAGRHKGRVGALLVEMSNGTQFAVGTGLSDAERDKPPAIGSVITFRYQELTDAGVPRFPTYVGIRQEALASPNREEATVASKTAQKLRRFEFASGASDKFWEIEIRGTDVHVRFGRKGTAGQAESKSFADAAKANKFAEGKIREKLGKGYQEVL